MRKRYRILSAVGLVFAIGIASLAIAVSYDAPCDANGPSYSGSQRMRAIVLRCYGGPELLTVEEVAKPEPEDDQALVKVHAAALNPLDWHDMRGEPYFIRLPDEIGSPDENRLGVDFAGIVEAVGQDVTEFKPGDEVFGVRGGALSEYVVARENRMVHKPANITFEEAAAVPVAAVTALQGLRKQGRVQSGHKVLINGASGGVGTFAVQLAKHFGAEVTGVCSTRNAGLVRSLGADHVVDYTKEDFTKTSERYDLILDNVANRSLSDLRRVLTDEGKLVIIGAGSRDPWIGPLILPLKAFVMSPFTDQEMALFIASVDQESLQFLADLLEAGKLRSVIDRRYSLDEAPQAMGYLETGRARAKVIVNVVEPESPLSSLGSG